MNAHPLRAAITLAVILAAPGLFTASMRLGIDFSSDYGHLELKQVREIPTPVLTYLPAAYLIGESYTYEGWQAECSTVFAMHRNKPQFQLQTRTLRFCPTNAPSFFGETTFRYLDGTNVTT